MTSDDRFQAVLNALDDDTCREILCAIEDCALTAAEVASVCNLPQSTAYRKLDLLAASPLVEERTRIRSDGKHASEYARTASGVYIELDDCEFDLTVTE
ncbi:MAG: helix-turn-helix domain-containing protein [Haloarculaceae archaeon]